MNACGAVGWTPARQSGDPGSNPKGGDFITMVARAPSTGGGIKQAAGAKGAPRGSKKTGGIPSRRAQKRWVKKRGEGAVRWGGGGCRTPQKRRKEKRKEARIGKKGGRSTSNDFEGAMR